MSFQVFSTVRRSAAACFGGPTASWMASMKPRIRPLLLFGPRPPGFRPLRAVAMSYTLRQDREWLQSVTAVYKPITHEGGNVFQIILLDYTVHNFLFFSARVCLIVWLQFDQIIFNSPLGIVQHVPQRSLCARLMPNRPVWEQVLFTTRGTTRVVTNKISPCWENVLVCLFSQGGSLCFTHRAQWWQPTLLWPALTPLSGWASLFWEHTSYCSLPLKPPRLMSILQKKPDQISLNCRPWGCV